MNLIDSIKAKAKLLNRTIVLPEGEAERTLLAADKIIAEKIAKLILIGDENTIKMTAEKLSLQNISKAEILDPADNKYKLEMINLLMDIRKEKGLTYNEASVLIMEPLYLGPLLVKMGLAHGEVSGAEHATGDVLRPAFQIIKTEANSSVVSGAFLMILKDTTYAEDGLLVFADCAVNPDPNEQQLAEIAVATAKTAQKIAGIVPRVAMLSFSTKGSAQHIAVDKVKNATTIARQMNPNLQIDGEMQADAAIVNAIGQKKAPGSTIAGRANVLVFPDLNSGNIAYKLVERLAGADAIGPVLQGMAAPINDLSRGCSVDDIVNLVAITVNQAV